MVWGAIAAVLSAQVIGALWYSPFLMGKLWMRTTFPNRSKESIAHASGPAYAVNIVSSAGIALMLNFILVNFFHVETVLEAVKFSVGLATLTALVDAPHLAFSQRSLLAYLIDHLFDTLSLVSMAACIFYLN
ncbi:hypothetical protein V1264_001375 [Littorina saxatilis]|uniref:DUF1761 domain-containing protein n=1 Tax=Littorina saxatilis TaxID=31220 RepID=A0AAN9BZC3_9CAEN